MGQKQKRTRVTLDRKSNKTRQKKREEIQKSGIKTDSPAIPDRGGDIRITGPPFGGSTHEKLAVPNSEKKNMFNGSKQLMTWNTDL